MGERGPRRVCGDPRVAAWALSLLAGQGGRRHRRSLPRRLVANARKPRAGVNEGRGSPRAVV